LGAFMTSIVKLQKHQHTLSAQPDNWGAGS